MKIFTLFLRHNARHWVLIYMMLGGVAIGCKDIDDGNDPLPEQKIASIYVANENGQSITVIDAITMTPIKNIDISDTTVSMAMPHNVQVAPDGKSVWATSMGMNDRDIESVVVIDPLTNEIIRRIYIGADLHLAHVVLDDASDNAFVTAYEGNQVYQIDAHSYAIIDSFQLDSTDGPHGIRYSNGKLYVADMDGMNLCIIDVTTRQISRVPVEGVIVQTAVTRNGFFALASLYDTKEVLRYTLATGQVTKVRLPSSAQGPIQIYPTPNSKYLYVCDQGGLMGRPASNKVYLIDIENATVVATVEVGDMPHGVVLSNDGKYAFVTNTGDNTVSVIQTDDRLVIQTIPTGASPNGIAYWYKTGGMP